MFRLRLTLPQELLNRANAAPLESGNSTLEEGGGILEIIVLLGVTAVGGIIGTVVGGLILDYIRNRTK